MVPSAFPFFTRSLHPLLALLSPTLLPPIQIGRGRGVRVGLGFASARWAKPAHASEGSGGCRGAGVAEVEAKLRWLVVDGRDSDVTFDEFHHLHCYLRRGIADTRVLCKAHSRFIGFSRTEHWKCTRHSACVHKTSGRS